MVEIILVGRRGELAVVTGKNRDGERVLVFLREVEKRHLAAVVAAHDVAFHGDGLVDVLTGLLPGDRLAGRVDVQCDATFVRCIECPRTPGVANDLDLIG